MKFFLIFLVIVSVATPAVGGTSTLRILQGDTLWGITESLGRPGQEWRQLYGANLWLPEPEERKGKTVVWVYPDDVLTLPQGWVTRTTSKIKVVGGLDFSASQIGLSLGQLWADLWSWVSARPWVW